MTEQKLQPEDLHIESFLPEHHEAVARMLLEFIAARSNGNATNELGLAFRELNDIRKIGSIIDRMFDEHPELEDERRAMDQRWWERLPEEAKEEFEGNQKILAQREKNSRFHVAFASPFAHEIHKANVQYHIERNDAQHRMVVQERERTLGYLAVWTGSSTLYIDGDHMQVDAKVVDPSLSIEEQKTVVAAFEPILYDLSLP